MLFRAFRDLWRLLTYHLDPISYHRRRGVRIGEGVELIAGTPDTFGSEPYLVTLGDHVTLSHGVEFVTHDGGLRAIRDRHPGAFYYAPIEVGDRAFLGAYVLVLPGVRIGARAVIGAGAVVTGDVESGSVYAGVPARRIGSVEDYATAREAQWIDTSNLSEVEKERVLRRHFDR